MKVGFATQDGQQVDAHFGWARHIALYDLSAEGYHHLDTVDFVDGLREDGDDDKLTPKLEAVRDCSILYVAAIGGSAAARVVALKVHPVKVAQPEPISAILDRLQEVLRKTPPPWLRKAMMKGQRREFDPDSADLEKQGDGRAD